MVEGGEFPGGEGHGIQQIGQQPDDLAPVDAVLDHPDQDPAGMRALLPGQVHPRQVRPVVQDLDRAAGQARPRPDQQMCPGPPNASRFTSVSGTSSVSPSTAATRVPRQNAPARPAGATGPASRRNTASITPAPSRCRARVNEDLAGIAPSIPSSAPTRFSATSS